MKNNLIESNLIPERSAYFAEILGVLFLPTFALSAGEMDVISGFVLSSDEIEILFISVVALFPSISDASILYSIPLVSKSFFPIIP